MRRECAFTLLEALLLVVILSIVGLGAAVGLQSIARIPPVADATLAINRQIVSDIEQLRATDWDSMTVGTTSSAVTINGQSYARQITIAAADADGGGNDTDFRQITVTIGSQTLSTYITEP